MYLNIVASSLKQPQIFLKRLPSEIRINAYSPMVLFLWRANMDVQFIINIYDVARYVTSYMSKVNKGLSDFLKHASRESKEGNYDSQLDHLKNFASKFIRGTEISAQEAALQVANLPSHYSTTKKVFVPTSEPDNRVQLLKPIEEIQNLPDNSHDIAYSNHLQRYSIRPECLKTVCLADWYAQFWYIPKD